MNHSSTTSPATIRVRRTATLGLALSTALLLGVSGAAFGINTADFSGGGVDHVASITSPVGTVPCFVGQLADRWGTESGPQPRCLAGTGDFTTAAHRTAARDRVPTAGSPCFLGRADWNSAEVGLPPTC